MAKSSEQTLSVEPDWTSFRQDTLQFTDALLSNFDVSLNISNSLSSRLIFLEVNGEQLTALELTDFDLVENGQLKEGKVFYFNLHGAYLDGYHVENFITISKYVLPEQVNEFSILPSFITSMLLQSDDDCDEDLDPNSEFCSGNLDEVVITVPSPSTGSSGPSYHFSTYWNPSFSNYQPERRGGGGRVTNTSCPTGQIKLPNGSCVKKPCAGDPLGNMQILGSIHNGIPGGQNGNGRGVDHDGTDFAAPYGTPVFAAHSGSVDTAPYQNNWQPNMNMNDAGNRVYISSLYNGSNLQFGYWHLGQVLVNPGDYVNAGQLIGYTGPTGNVTSKHSAGPHLHVRARRNGAKADPEDFLNADLDENGTNTNNCN